MKISPALIDKYNKGLCSDQEAKVVENWLNSSEDELSDIQESVLQEMEQRIWSDLEHKIDRNPFLSWKKPIIKYGAVACITGITFFNAGLHWNKNISETANNNHLSVIYAGKKQILKGSTFEIKGSGIVAFNNPTTEVKTIICDGESYNIAPDECLTLHQSIKAKNKVIPITSLKHQNVYDQLLSNDFSYQLIKA